ncbi:MAG TPA: PAS domain S-box protein, partial [Segetibacter sp.]
MREKYRILHVEDIATDAELIARELRQSHVHFDHLVIDKREDYIAALQSFSPDIVLCDHSLPSFNSLEAVRILRENNGPTPFILITANLSEEVVNGVMQAGADDYILKDMLKRLPHAVMNLIQKHRYEKERKLLIDEAKHKETVAHEALSRLSKKLLLATESAGVGIWEYNLAEDRFIFDDLLLSLYNVTTDKADGSFEDWMDFIHPADKEKVKAEFGNALTSDPGVATEYRIVWKDGTVRYIKATISIQRNASGEPLQIIGTNQDVTSSRQAEVALKESESRYRSFFENSMDGILLADRDGPILAANPAACAIFGMSEAEICRGEKLSLVDAADSQRDTLIKELYRSGKAKGEVLLKRKNGTSFPGEVMSAAFKDMNGRERTMTIIKDVTVHKETEQKIIQTSIELQQTLNGLNKIMDSSMDIICVIDGEGKFVNVSSASTNIWGYAPQELTGKKYIEMVFEEDVEYTLQVAKGILNGRPVSMFENRYVHKSGKVVPVLWSARWDCSDGLMYCVAKDATEKKKLEKAFISEKQRFYELFLHAPSSIGVLTGPDYVFEMANPMFLELIARNNVIGKSIKEVLPELAEQKFITLLDQVYETGETFRANELPVKLLRNGRIENTFISFTCQANRNAEGIIEGIFIFAIDVTEQLQSRKKIEESEQRFRELIQDLPEAMYTCDAEGRIMLYNKAAVTLWGRKPE